jgi:hypothetical protein
MQSRVESIVVLTGAGVSAESGVATFRGSDGLWEGQRVEDVATPEAFRRDPALVHAFYDARRTTLGTVEPNAARRRRHALAQDRGGRSSGLSSRTPRIARWLGWMPNGRASCCWSRKTWTICTSAPDRSG